MQHGWFRMLGFGVIIQQHGWFRILCFHLLSAVYLFSFDRQASLDFFGVLLQQLAAASCAHLGDFLHSLSVFSFCISCIEVH